MAEITINHKGKKITYDMETISDIVSKIKAANELIRFLWGCDFEKKIQKHKDTIKTISVVKRQTNITTLLDILDIVKQEATECFGIEAGMTSLVYMAATFELSQE